MTGVNPFVAAMAVRAWHEAGNMWARLALICKDRALKCGESGFRELAKRIDAERAIDEWAVEAPTDVQVGGAS
jgi:hypothetical protein